jgi:hypothetical protein
MHAGAFVYFWSLCVTLVLLRVCIRMHAPTCTHIHFLPFPQQLYLMHFRVILGNACYRTFHAQDFIMNITVTPEGFRFQQQVFDSVGSLF